MKYIFANLKNNSVTNDYYEKLEKVVTDKKIVIFPKKEDLKSIKTNISLGLQNYYDNDLYNSNSYDYVLLGHYDYRLNNYETDEIVNEKIKRCLNLGYKVVVCCNSFDEILNKLKEVNSFENIIIAYEPHNYIGTGMIIDKKIIEEFILKVRREYNNIKIIYGGGVTNKNINELKNIKDLCGVLIGSSSLDFECFKEIIKNY